MIRKKSDIPGFVFLLIIWVIGKIQDYRWKKKLMNCKHETYDPQSGWCFVCQRIRPEFKLVARS